MTTTVTTPAAVAIGRAISVGPVIGFIGRLPWSREPRASLRRHWASVAVFGFYIGICWR